MRRFVCLMLLLTCGEALAAPRIVVPPTATGGGYTTVENSGTPLTQRTTINFTGSGVTCVDDTTKTTCTVTAGAGSTNFAQVVIDFGCAAGGACDGATTVVTGATWVGAASKIVCALDGTLGTADHAADEEDAIIEQVQVFVTKKVNGTGFTILGHAPNLTWGRYVVNCVG